MNEQIIKIMAKDLNIRESQIINTLNLLQDGATIPFIARYRKEVTSNLDEEQIRAISEVYEYQNNLLKRKEDVIRLIAEKDLLTDELQSQIMNATKLIEVEDLYRPFKEKKKTKATEAIANGLEPLAKIIMNFPNNIPNFGEFINEKVSSEEKAIEGAGYIISEWISDNAFYRKWIRNQVMRSGIISSKVKKNAVDENKVYEMYYNYSEAIRNIKKHRILALNRGEKEEIISVSIDFEKETIINYLEAVIIKEPNSPVVNIVKTAIADSLKRLIWPSIEREIRSELTEESEDGAIDVFKENLERLLLTPPMKDKKVLGLDPAYRTGCKLAVIDITGKPLEIKVIYPHEPKNEWEASKKALLELVKKYQIDIIAIGNGTASRESEALASELIKENNLNTKYVMVNEAGASVYSASKLAIGEFPDLHVEERSAISIARRLQDPLSELVKIDPKSIGVGQYQHDVTPKKLSDSLDFVVMKAVNSVGVNLNVASSSLLQYVSGVNKKIIDTILEYRNKNGKITSREELKKIKGISAKTFEQAAPFLRIFDGNNPLDKTSIHPESYKLTKTLLDSLNLTLEDLGSEKLIKALNDVNLQNEAVKFKTDIYTLTDIIAALKAPLRDPRDAFDAPLLKSDILKLEDLKPGMKLQGTVRNVVDFGIFIDIGIKNDGLAHISKLSNKYIKHPSELFKVGDIVDCYVDEVFIEKKKVALRLIDETAK